jgi:alpha-beta hydrolase superfamily lysophospholipase
MLRVLGVALAVLAASATGLACGSSQTKRTAAPKAPALATECGPFDLPVKAQPFWLETSDGVRLYAIEAGDGSTTAVLAHQGQSNLCDTLDYAKTLLASGLRIVAFDFRGNGLSQRPTRHALALSRDLAAAVARAHAHGADHVFLIGASMGGAAAVQNSAGLPVAGVVSLSGTRLWPGYGINEPGSSALRAPLLYLGSRDDSNAPLKEAQTVVRTAGSQDKRSALYPGALHGWQLVQGTPRGASTRALILAWIRAHS